MNRREALHMNRWMLTYLVLPLIELSEGTMRECYSCVSNEDWSYYMERIPSPQLFNLSVPLPVAPFACTFDPLRIYSDHTVVKCQRDCVKWSSVMILEDGSLKVNVLRTCADLLFNSSTALANEDRCYQTPHDFTHKKGIEYQSVCYCKSFMCNLTSLTFKFPIYIIVIYLFNLNTI